MYVNWVSIENFRKKRLVVAISLLAILTAAKVCLLIIIINVFMHFERLHRNTIVKSFKMLRTIFQAKPKWF